LSSETLINIQVGFLITGLVAFGKLIWHLSKKDSEAKETRAMAVRAHKRIDKLEDNE
jgi:hypothetical protein